MSFAVQIAHHLSVPVAAIGFALTLVAVLVTAEEREVRRQKSGDRELSGA